MNSHTFHNIGLLLLLIVCIGLAACSGPGLRGGAGDRAMPSSAGQGDQYARAAARYAAQARQQSSSQKRDQLRMKAATAALRAKQPDQARQLLDPIDAEQLDAADRQQYQLLQTLLRAVSMSPEQALDIVPPPAAGTPPALAALVWKTRATLLFTQYKYIAGIHDLVQRSVWLLDDNAVEQNNRLIFKRAVEAVGLGRDADSPAARQADTTTLGWLRLAAIKHDGPSGGAALQQALEHWEKQFTGHPATATVLANQFHYQPFSSPQPRPSMRGGLESGPIVLALPLSGDIAEPAKAIRAGFEMAHAGDDSDRSLAVIDSTNLTPQDLLQQARNQNAALLVGPLQKDKVAALASQAPNIPVLALNQIHGLSPPPWFYRYALAPEDDARTVAHHAADQGWHSALALVPEGDWGNRVLDAFQTAFAARGGDLVASARFATDHYDHRAAVQSVLRHRGTGDVVFIAAQPTHARLLRSQLRYYRAGDLPVVATSNVYSGLPEPRKDSDLDGVEFAAVPWQVSTDADLQAARLAAEKQAGAAAQRFPRLFAMGIDAWQLASRMAQSGLESGMTLHGTTGELAVEPDGRVRRYLAWARFDEGRAELVSPAPNNDDSRAAAAIELPSVTDTDTDTEKQHATITRPVDSEQSETRRTGPAFGPVYDDESSDDNTPAAATRAQDAARPTDYGPVYGD